MKKSEIDIRIELEEYRKRFYQLLNYPDGNLGHHNNECPSPPLTGSTSTIVGVKKS